jgi:branched-chain amino acid transport system ATP-binding protein
MTMSDPVLTEPAAPSSSDDAHVARSGRIEAHGIRSGYDEVEVLHSLDFSIRHEVFAVLGANGAGKTTLMKTIARVLPLMGGTMTFRDEDTTEMQPYTLAARGLAFVPQEANTFPAMTVAENLRIGALIGKRPTSEKLDDLFELFPDLKPRLGQKAGTLSGGESQMLAVGRALMQEPRVLLLDEPTAGLSPKYADNLFSKVRDIHEQQDISVVLAEQNAAKTLAVADRVMVLSLGRINLIDDTQNVDTAALKEGYLIQ